ncbi:BTAD domain-containing putative transcriptional regulator [Nonomuraea sp. NPDC046570]|uniref:AfsR/SARP family transcriptional regulator n=1 Tax=Nonomuraea sp. NPDC046570 TaxID=3155255 RepID=UPI0033E0CCD8
MIHARVLGPLEVSSGGRLVDVGGPRPRLLLAALLLQAGEVVSLDRLADLVWEGNPPASAHAQVRVRIARLRRVLGHDAIGTAPGGYQVREEAVVLDTLEAERLLAAARAAGAPERSALLREALGLWRGPVLDGMSHPAVTYWEERFPVIAEEWAATELELDRHREAVVELTSLVARYPLRERLRGQLMRALWRAGRTAAALEVFAEGRQSLIAELGTEPGTELRGLHEEILRGTPGTGPALLPPPPDVPVRVDELERLLRQRPSPGVVVISGGAGAGKSALALRWAHQAADRFPDGQLFADLGAQDAVMERFLRALGVPDERIPDDEEERAALFRSALRGLRVLILLDDAASSAQVRPLLPGAPGCLVVVTARRRLAGLVAADNAATLHLDMP